MLAIHTHPNSVRTRSTSFQATVCVWLCVEVVHLVWVRGLKQGENGWLSLFSGSQRKGCSYSASHARMCVVFIIMHKKRSVCVRWLWERKLKYSHIQSRFKVKLGLSTLKQAPLSLCVCGNKPFEKNGRNLHQSRFHAGNNQNRNGASTHTATRR